MLYISTGRKDVLNIHAKGKKYVYICTHMTFVNDQVYENLYFDKFIRNKNPIFKTLLH
jgi:hypothetical protein